MIVVGSINPAKLNPAREVFGRVAPGVEVVGLGVPSGVPGQPIGFRETLLGAQNRALGALASEGAIWGAGLEGGVEFDSEGRGWLFGVVAVAHGSRVTSSRSASLQLPPEVTRRVLAGEELGPVMDGLSGVRDNKRQGGAYGYLSGGLLERADVWRQALVLALTPQLNAELYAESKA